MARSAAGAAGLKSQAGKVDQSLGTHDNDDGASQPRTPTSGSSPRPRELQGVAPSEARPVLGGGRRDRKVALLSHPGVGRRGRTQILWNRESLGLGAPELTRVAYRFSKFLQFQVLCSSLSLSFRFRLLGLPASPEYQECPRPHRFPRGQTPPAPPSAAWSRCPPSPWSSWPGRRVARGRGRTGSRRPRGQLF